MKFRVLTAIHKDFSFKIEEDLPEVGAYLYIYQNDFCIKDYLQNDIDMCKAFAYEKYLVPLDAWKEQV